jgi:Na+-transporting NADH:ubiquinone oxidoreductase subunit NqrD
MKRVARDNERAVNLVVGAQVCFVLFIAICVAIHPGFVLKRNEGGMSNYGIHLETAVPYTFALLGLAGFSRRAAVLLNHDDPRVQRLRRILYAYSVIVFVMLLSTYVYTRNLTLRDFHFGFGTVLICFEVASSLWMFRLCRRFIWDDVFLFMQLAGSILCLVTIVGALHVLFFAEMLTAAGFAGLIIHTSRCVSTSLPASEPRSVQGMRDSIS